ncbi:DUF6777 domain-containing protein [Streptacidiphilus sp. PAMC 29251]
MSTQPPADTPAEPPVDPPAGPPAGPPSGPVSGPSSSPPPSGQIPGPPSAGRSRPEPPPVSPQAPPAVPGGLPGGVPGAVPGAEPPTQISGTPPAPPPPDRRLSAASASGRPHRPWWRRPLALAGVVGVAAIAVVLALVLNGRTSKSANTSAQALALQPVNDAGPAPFTPSVAKAAATPTPTPTASTAGSGAPGTTTGGGTTTVQGSATGLYGGSERLSSCDVAQLSAFLTSHPDKGKAWAAVEGIPQNSIPTYLKSLTPVVLRVDTRVTNHGFSNGAATSFQSVLQSGTAVLIDGHGLPRARCACGNPLSPPVQSTAPQTYTGTAWSSFRSSDIVVVEPSVTQITVVVLYDPQHGTWFNRPIGSHGSSDHKVPPPTPTSSSSSSSSASTSTSPSTSASSSTSGSASPTGTTASPSTAPSHTSTTPTPTVSAPTTAATPPSSLSGAPLNSSSATGPSLLTLEPQQGLSP